MLWTIHSRIFCAYGMDIGVGCGVHEVDGVGDSVFDRELDGVEIVAECFAEGERVAFDAGEQSRIVGWRIEDVSLCVGAAWVVGHNADLLLADDVAAEIAP